MSHSNGHADGGEMKDKKKKKKDPLEWEGMPLFACAWPRDNLVVFGGGGGLKGTGVSSGVAVAHVFRARGTIHTIQFIETDDNIVNSFSAASPTYLYASVSDSTQVFQWDPTDPENKGLLPAMVHSFKTDFASGKDKQGNDIDPFQSAIAVSPVGGRLIATGGEDCVVKIFSVENSLNPKEISLWRKYSGPEKSIFCLDWNKNGDTFAATSAEKVCYVFTCHENLEKKMVHLTLQDNQKNQKVIFKGCRFSKEDPHILYTWVNFTMRGPGSVLKWDVRTGTVLQIAAVSKDGISQGAISNDGQFLALGTSGGVSYVLKTSDFRKCNHRMKHQMPITGISFSPDSKYVLSVSGDGSYDIFPTYKKANVGLIMVIVFLILAILAVGIQQKFNIKL
eukprot:TRINITY_DN6846_c0_g1_i3.p1 TRINITY_DN6846_c0_g1~~TRINITY_DN6846_c0_g1_i3.p1  ORF type:complete len:393 (+),score=100.09 TRINITY_DN6846_c0_g1_i3:97-1275(+)